MDHAMGLNSDEFARQRVLDGYRVVDSLPEAAYDDIVRLASILCEAPIALISLIDRDRQWLKARVGLEFVEAPRNEAFCNHAIRVPDELMEVEDMRKDPRFADNPHVTGDAPIRFYAGMPLVAPGGAAIGTVCVLDREPRVLTDAQRVGLSSLARLTITLLEARHRERELERSALLAAAVEVEQAPAAAMPDAMGCTVAIFEVQDLAGAAIRHGDRAVTRALQQLAETLEGGVRHHVGDTVNHSTGSSEMIVVLQGADTAATLQALRDCLPAFERETALRVLSASADSEDPNERLEELFQRADIALTQEKDLHRADSSAN